MSTLAQYLPQVVDESVPTEFFDVGIQGVVESRMDLDRAIDDVASVSDIQATLEALCVSIESIMDVNPYTPVFINHTLNAINRRTGLRVPVASMEDANLVISQEGLGDVIKRVWDALVTVVKTALAAVATFFRRVWEFITGKKSKVEANFKKAEAAGDATPAKLAAENTLDKIKDKKVIGKLQNKLDNKQLAKARPSELVLLTPNAAQVIDRAKVLGGESGHKLVTEDISFRGKDYTVAMRQEVQKAQYLRIGQATNDLIAHASCAGITFKGYEGDKCIITIADLTELIWESLFRAKVTREVGNVLGDMVYQISANAILELKAYFQKGGRGLTEWYDNSHLVNEKIFKDLEQLQPEFKKLRSQSGLIPFGRRVGVVGRGETLAKHIDVVTKAPELAGFTDRTILMEIPTWGDSKKASDGVTSMMVLNTQKNLIADINKKFDATLALWTAAVEWIGQQGHKDPENIINLYAGFTNIILTNTQNVYNSIVRSQMSIEANVVQWADQVSGTMARLSASKDLIDNFD